MNQTSGSSEPNDTTSLEMICTSYDRQTLGKGTRRVLTATKRLNKSLKIFGLGIGCTLLALFIPFLHFFLVPLFALGTLFLSIVTWLDQSEIIEASVSCPNCKQFNQWFNISDSWPKQERCCKCTFLLTLTVSTQKLSG